MTIEKLKGQLLAAWHDVPAVELCLRILDFMNNSKIEHLRMMTFGDLAKVTGKNKVDSDVLTAVSILTNSQMPILDAGALLVDDDGAEYEISLEDFAEARASGLLIHPHTGLEIADYESHIIPFFMPSERFIAESHGN